MTSTMNSKLVTDVRWTVTKKIAALVSTSYLRTIFDGDSIFDGASLALELNRTAVTVGGTIRYTATPLTLWVS